MASASKLAAARRERLLKTMAEEGCEALVVFGNAWQGDYLRYGTDCFPAEGDALAVIGGDGEMRLFVESEAEAQRAAGAHIKPVATSDIVGEARAYLKRLGNRRVRSAPGTILPFGLADDKELRLEDGTAMLDKLLMAKLPEEIEMMRRGADLADRGYKVFMDACRIGRPEYALVADVEAFFRGEGCPENFMILGSGGVEVRGMHPPGERKLQQGDLVTTELTPAVEGYYVQLCRTLVVGEPSYAQVKAHDVYIEAAAAGEAILKTGVTAAAVARAENDVFRVHGLGLYCTSEYTRVRGHGLGLFPDSKPHLLEDVEVPLPRGAAVIVHPNTYHPEVGYIVFGDTLIVKDDGFERLMKTPRKLLSVPA